MARRSGVSQLNLLLKTGGSDSCGLAATGPNRARAYCKECVLKATANVLTWLSQQRGKKVAHTLNPMPADGGPYPPIGTMPDPSYNHNSHVNYTTDTVNEDGPNDTND